MRVSLIYERAAWHARLDSARACSSCRIGAYASCGVPKTGACRVKRAACRACCHIGAEQRNAPAARSIADRTEDGCAACGRFVCYGGFFPDVTAENEVCGRPVRSARRTSDVHHDVARKIVATRRGLSPRPRDHYFGSQRSYAHRSMGSR